MFIKKVTYENFTVFEKQTISFTHGINVLIGENGAGKTHVMKSLYSACQSADPKVSFPHKLVMTMLPDDYKISRLVTRGVVGESASIRIVAAEQGVGQDKVLKTVFDGKTKKWDAEVLGNATWEEEFSGMGTSSIFIPAKEILSNSYNLSAAVGKNNVRFDETYLDIIDAAKVDVSKDEYTDNSDFILKDIESMTDGTVIYDSKKDEFYLKKGKFRQEFNLVAEGIRKMALLWQLVKNGALKKGSVLFWDEPEANINPSYIPHIVEILFALQRRGIQIFVSTHDYMLASYFEVKKQQNDSVLFHSLSRAREGVVQYESGEKFGDLKNNTIIVAFNQLLDEIYDME